MPDTPMSPALHPQAQALVDAMAHRGAVPDVGRTVAESRRRLALLTDAIGRGPDVRSVVEVAIPVDDGAIDGRLYVPETDRPQGVLVYFHGGGWVSGDLDGFDAVCRQLAVNTSCRVLSVAYRLAPEHPFPQPLRDAFAACQWAVTVADGDPLMIIGDSAGGTLAAGCALLARDRGAPELALQVLVYPMLDCNFDTDSYREHATGSLVGRSDMQWFWGEYLQGSPTSDPLACPMKADLHGVAPALIVVAHHDPLRDDGLRYASRLRDAKVQVNVHRYDDMFHGFFTMVNIMDTSAVAIARVGEVVAEVCRGKRFGS